MTAKIRHLSAFPLDIHSLPDGFVRLDERGCILDFNCRAEQLFGYAANEVAGQPLSLLIPPEWDKPGAGLHWTFPDTGRILSGEGFWARALRKDGRWIEVEYTLRLLGDGGRIAGAAALFRDVSHPWPRVRALDGLTRDADRNRLHPVRPDGAGSPRRCDEMRWAGRISEALDEDRLLLRYQPIIPTQEIDVAERHFEILVSLREGDSEPVPPGAFIPEAERFGLMPRIDRWVVENVFRFVGRHRGLICWINLSSHTLADDSFEPFVEEKLSEHGLDPRSIVFEITESAAIANLQQTLRLIERLKVLGCRFALDDFGSGMSSFAYLKHLPVDFLKIDGGFVRDMADDRVDHAMVDAINKVGQVMNLKTVAEFVETESVLRQLRELGVDYAQGYYISRPYPLDDLSGRAFERRSGN